MAAVRGCLVTTWALLCVLQWGSAVAQWPPAAYGTVDAHRPGIVERLVATHGAAMVSHGISLDAFRTALWQLPADRLLAASVADSPEEINTIVAQAGAGPGVEAKDGSGSGLNSWLGYTGGGNVASGSGSAVAAGTHNVASGVNAFVAAGTFNTASGQASFVGAGTSNVASGTSSLVMGGFDNRATVIDAAVVAGAGNRATGARSVVVGGGYNLASGQWSFIGGGGRQTGSGAAGTNAQDNVASGDFAVIGGGVGNFIAPAATYAVVAGGTSNAAIAPYGSVVGGVQNVVTADYSMIPGGFQNQVQGKASFAAGTKAFGAGDGQFLWADATNQMFDPSNSVQNDNGLYWLDPTNTFNVRATGGVMFVTGVNGTGWASTGVSVSPGSGTWVSHSDRNIKENFADVDAASILDKVVQLPISTWNYIGEGRAVRHIGPVAQDFHAAFGVGPSDRTIAVVDADGVALAAIQGLARKLEEKTARIERLERALRALEAKLGLD